MSAFYCRDFSGEKEDPGINQYNKRHPETHGCKKPSKFKAFPHKKQEIFFPGAPNTFWEGV